MRPLRHNLRFQLIWLGSAFSSLGVEVGDIGYPLLVLGLTGSPGWAGAFATVQLLSSVLTGLPAGRVVDRFDRRLVLLTAEGCRVLAGGAVAVTTLLDALTLPMLLAVAAVFGATAPFAGAARMLLVRSVVAPEQLTAALTQDEVRTSAASLAGPPLGGFLYGLARAVPFLFTIAAFGVSWLCAVLVRLSPEESRPHGGGHPGGPGPGGMLVGVRALVAEPTLRAATLLVTGLNAAGAPLALIAVVVLRRQHVSAALIGVAMAGLAVGGLAGAGLVAPLHRRLRPGVILLGVGVAEVILLAALSVPWGPWWVAAMLFLAMLGVPALRVLVDVLIFRQVSDEQRGRVIAATMTLFGVGAPVGTAAAGLLLQFTSPQTATLAIAGALAVGVAYSLTKRNLRAATWPEQPAP